MMDSNDIALIVHLPEVILTNRPANMGILLPHTDRVYTPTTENPRGVTRVLMMAVICRTCGSSFALSSWNTDPAADNPRLPRGRCPHPLLSGQWTVDKKRPDMPVLNRRPSGPSLRCG